VQLETSTPADGPGEFVNVLNPHIELYSPANVLIATGVPLADGRNESLLSTGLAPGTYRVRVTSEGSTTGEYFLTTGPAAAFSPAGATLVNESCPPTNGAIDPGERVSVNFKIMNNSGAATSNLVATLQSTGGVIAPTGPQSYGAIPNGGMAERQFAFTASAGLTPGQTLTATLQLQDGATNLGTVSYNFIAGPTPCGSVRLVVTQVLSRTSPSTVQAVITIQNIGALTASNTLVTIAKLGTTDGTPLPQSLGSIAPGASAVATVNFNNSTPGASTLKVGGTYSTGSFSSNVRVTVP
jgi:hypothetical protein